MMEKMEASSSSLLISGDQQIVLSQAEAAQLLAQAGIELSDNDQVIIGGVEDGQIQLGIESLACRSDETESTGVLGSGNGEILYIDPNDPHAAALLEQAGLTLGPDGTVQALVSEDRQNLLAELSEESSAFESHHVDSLTPSTSSLNDEAPSPPVISLPQIHPSRPQSQSQQQSQQRLHQQQQVSQIQQQQSRSHQSVTPQVHKKAQQQQQQHQQQQQQIVQVGHDQQQVLYSVTSEDGKTQQYMMLCPKDMDQQTLIQTLVKQITSDPNNKGKKTIRITKQRGNKSLTPAVPKQTYNKAPAQRRMAATKAEAAPVDLLDSALMAIEDTKENFESVTQELLASRNPSEPGNHSTPSSLPNSTSNSNPTPTTTLDLNSTRVFVRCNYCTEFRTILNGDTWESILNHVLPVSKEEIQTTFYGDLGKHFIRNLRIQVNGRQIVKTAGLMIPQCEVILTHSLICRRTKREFLLDKPNANFVADLAKHIKNTQPSTTANKGNSLLCVFCNSPYTYEDYIRHVTPHQDAILATLNCFSGSYCANSYESMIKHHESHSLCQICSEVEQADLRFTPCTKFSSEYTCTKKLQFAIDCFRENYGDNGFMRLNTSSVTRCSVCKNNQNVYCAVFHISTTVVSEETQEVHDVDSQLSVCINCQKQFINIVMKEQEFEERLKVFQLKNMEQLCSCLRVILSMAPSVCETKNALIYTVQENSSNASASVHSLRSADVAEVVPITKLVALSETEVTTSRIKAYYACDQCGFSLDLTSLISSVAQTQKNDMLLAVVLEHLVPHTESLINVLAASAANQTFNLKFEIIGRVSESNGIRKIHLSLHRKFKSQNSAMEIPLDKDEEKTMMQIRAGVKAERKTYVAVRSSGSVVKNSGSSGVGSSALGYRPSGDGSGNQLIEVNKFIDRQRGKFTLLAQCGCNTTLLSLYAECRLCSKFSYPDFRLSGTAASVDLCENCVDTVLTLCLSTEPEVLQEPEPCLVLSEDRDVGHRLVLSNNHKKWLSLDGVNLIKRTVDEFEDIKPIDTSALLNQALRKHLLAALKKCWLDPMVVTVSAGFCITDTFLAGVPNEDETTAALMALQEQIGIPIQRSTDKKSNDDVIVKVLAKKAPPVVSRVSASSSMHTTSMNTTNTMIRSTNIKNGSNLPHRRRIVISNGSGGVIDLPPSASEAKEEESVSAIQSFLDSTASSVSGVDVMDDLKVPSGIKITSAGKGVVNIRAVAESRSSSPPSLKSKNNLTNTTSSLTPTSGGTGGVKGMAGVSMVTLTSGGQVRRIVEPVKNQGRWNRVHLHDEGDDLEDEEEEEEEESLEDENNGKRRHQDSEYFPDGGGSSPIDNDLSRSKRKRKEKKIFDL